MSKQQITDLETKLRRCRDENKRLRDTLAGKTAPRPYSGPAAGRKIREEILALCETGTHTVADLAAAAKVVERTVWRHLSAMLDEGRVKRVDDAPQSPHTFTATRRKSAA